MAAVGRVNNNRGFLLTPDIAANVRRPIDVLDMRLVPA